MMLLTAYVVSLVVFVGVDFVWLSTMGAALYRSTLGDLLAPDVRLPPAIVFYLAYPVGIVVFAAASIRGKNGSALPKWSAEKNVS